MDELLSFATARQLAKLQYWATRALDFDHGMSVQRARMAVHEFAEDVKQSESSSAVWWERIESELEHLDAEIRPSGRPN